MNEVKFYVEKRGDKTENLPILAAFSFDKNEKRLVIHTKKQIDLDKWDKDNQKVKKGAVQGHETAVKINAHLNKISGAMIKIYERYEALERKLTLQTFKDELRAAMREAPTNKGVKLLDYLDDFISERSIEEGWRENTQKSWASFRERLKNMEGGISDLNVKYFDKFINNPDWQNSTRNKYMVQMKCFVDYLATKKLIAPGEVKVNIKVPLLGFSEQQEQNLVYLTFAELKAIDKLKNLSKDLEEARDIFMFACWTGMRYSDFTTMQKINDKGQTLVYYSRKTKTKTTVKVLKKVRAIINKYKGQHDTLLPYHDPMKLNVNIRRLGKLAKLNKMVTYYELKGGDNPEPIEVEKWQLLSSHVGRKTFICNCIEVGMSPNKIMKAVGQKNWSSFKHYYAVSDKSISDDMEKLEGR